MKKVFVFLLLCTCLLGGCQDAALTAPTNTAAPATAEPPQQTPSPVPSPDASMAPAEIPPETPLATPSADAPTSTEAPAEVPPVNQKTGNGITIVLDPGHGKSSSQMTDNEKINAGFTYVEGKGWGEWRHFKSGTMWQDCQGSGCSMRAPKNGSCWYSITSGDRDTEPDLNYNNALAAKKYLEQYGYNVRLTRLQSENPSLNQRLKSCYPGGNIANQPDAAAYVCLHANAGGGKGSYYISLSGLYDQGGKPGNYIEAGNELGRYINDSIVQNTPLTAAAGGRYDGYPELVIFCKSPVPVAYMEIGFYDNQSDLQILRTQSDAIGKAIADGIHKYFSGVTN